MDVGLEQDRPLFSIEAAAARARFMAAAGEGGPQGTKSTLTGGEKKSQG